VRREGITEAAGALQRASLIHYSRGKITVLDRQGLEARVCECYRVVKTEFDRLLAEPATRSSGSFNEAYWLPAITSAGRARARLSS
jgi:hypothetical protein